jgi:hypothetical protein
VAPGIDLARSVFRKDQRSPRPADRAGRGGGPFAGGTRWGLPDDDVHRRNSAWSSPLSCVHIRPKRWRKRPHAAGRRHSGSTKWCWLSRATLGHFTPASVFRLPLPVRKELGSLVVRFSRLCFTSETRLLFHA